MVLVCQTCGMPGYTELLIYCNICKSSAEHRYCLDILPSYHEEVSWSCDLCKPRPSKVEIEILRRSMRKLKCKKIRKRCQTTITAPQFAPPQKQPHYNKSPATVHGQLSIRKSPASLLQKEVDDLPQSFRVQLKDKKLKKRRRLVMPVDDQLDEDIQTNNMDAKYEKTLTAPKHDSPEKRQEYVPHSPHVHMENNGDSTINGKWNRPSDSLLQKKVIDLSQSFGIQFERKNLKRRRMILPEDDQLDGDVLNNSAVNKRLLEARYENTVVAPKVASPENLHQYVPCTHSVQNGTCAGATVNEKSNKSTNSLLQKEVDDLFQSIRMQSEEKNLRMRRTRLILLEGEQLGQEAQTNDAVDKRHTEVRYEKTVMAIKAASPGKPHQYVYEGNYAGPAEDGISNRSTDNLLQKKVVDSFKSFRMQLERKNLRMQSRRLILLEDDQLDDVHINNEANEGHLKAEKSVNVSSELSDGRFLKKMSGLPNECLLDEEVHINCTGQNSPIRGPLQLHPTLQVEHTPGRKMICTSASSYEPYNLPAQPIRNHIWRGHFHICNKELGPFTAHISSKACEKVWNIAKKLPAVLQMTKLSRLDSWPKSFKTSPPNDESIALYFFAQDARVGAMLDELLCEITKKDLVLKVKHDEAELLAFSSIVLPESYRKFQEKYFLWGVFRRRQGAVSCAPAECSPSYDEITEEKEWAPDLKHPTKKESDDIAENCIVANKLVENSNNSEEKRDECHDRNACLLPSGKQIPLNCVYPSGEQIVSDCEMARPSNGCKVYHQELFAFNLDHDEGTTNYPMNLFPEQGEDMALTSRLRGSDSLDLKLGYSWSTCDDAHLKDMFNGNSLS